MNRNKWVEKSTLRYESYLKVYKKGTNTSRLPFTPNEICTDTHSKKSVNAVNELFENVELALNFNENETGPASSDYISIFPYAHALYGTPKHGQGRSETTYCQL